MIGPEDNIDAIGNLTGFHSYINCGLKTIATIEFLTRVALSFSGKADSVEARPQPSEQISTVAVG